MVKATVTSEREGLGAVGGISVVTVTVTVRGTSSDTGAAAVRSQNPALASPSLLQNPV